MSAQRPLGATQRPLGAAENAAVEISADALRVAAPGAIRSSRTALVALSGMVVSVLMLTVAAAHTEFLLPESVRPVPSWLAGPFGGASINIRSGGLIACLVVMFVCYALAVRTAEQASARAVLMCIAAINALILLAPPLLSTDIFSYQFYGRMGALYGANPYLAGPHAMMLDPLFPFVGAKWSYTPTVYGPLFTILSYFIAPLSIADSALVYKAIAAAASLGTVAVVWNAARLRGVHPVKAVALVGLNPLTVVYGVGGGHNDLLMLLALMGGVYLLLARKDRPGGAMMVVAAAIKVSAILPMLFALISDRARGQNVRRGVLIGGLAAAAGMVVLSFGVFGTGPLHLPITLEKVQSEGDWHSVPGLVSGLGFPTLSAVFSLILGAVFLGVVAWLAWRVWNGTLDWLAATAWMTVTILLTTSSLLPWYVAWLMPLTALVADRRLWRFSVAATGFILALQLAGYIPAAKEMLGV